MAETVRSEAEQDLEQARDLVSYARRLVWLAETFLADSLARVNREQAHG